MVKEDGKRLGNVVEVTSKITFGSGTNLLWQKKIFVGDLFFCHPDDLQNFANIFRTWLTLQKFCRDYQNFANIIRISQTLTEFLRH